MSARVEDCKSPNESRTAPAPSPPPFSPRVQIGAWVVDPGLDEISSNGAIVKLEPKTMRLLLYLITHRERVVGQQELLDNLWSNVIVTPQSIYGAIAQLRQALGDSAESPAYIATIPRKGYRLIAAVATPQVSPAPPAPPATGHDMPSAAPQSMPTRPFPRRRRLGLTVLLTELALVTAVFVAWHHERAVTVPPVGASASIGVLPFLDLSEKQDSQYLADGVTEELIDLLAHTAALHVPARTSSFYFKGRSETVAEIARQLNVANLLEGSVRRADGKIRVTAQLIRADDGFHQWSETYTRDDGDVLAAEDDIAQAVANTLRARLIPSADPGSSPPLDGAAHRVLLECEFYRERNTPADGEKALVCFRRLIEVSAGSARAWAGYADILMRQPMLSGAAADLQRAGGIDAVKAARRALELDPHLAAAHAVIANDLRIFEHDWRGAAAEIEAALLADGNDPTTLLAAAALAKDLGHLDRFIALCERAQTNDPLNFQPYARLAAAYLYQGRLADAETMARRRLDLSPNGGGGRSQLVEVLLARGRSAEALQEIEREPVDYLRGAGYTMIYHALGRHAEADAALAQLISRFGVRQPTRIAEALAFRGDIDRAFEFLSRAVADGDRNVLDIKSSYYFRKLHGDTRYQDLLKVLSLPLGP